MRPHCDRNSSPRAAVSIGSIPALQTVSRWLDSMQELLVNGLFDDAKALAKDVISRHIKIHQEIANNAAKSSKRLATSTVFINEDPSERFWSEVASEDGECIVADGMYCNDGDNTIFDQLDNCSIPIGKASSRESLGSVLNDTTTLQQWLEEQKHQPIDDEAFLIPSDLFLPLVREAVRRQVEIELFSPLENHIRIVISDICLEYDCIISENLQQHAGSSQTDFGIPKTIQSPSNWKPVAKLLSAMFERSIPFDRIQALKAAVREIPALYHAEREERDAASGKKSPVHIGADDMLPIFIYLLATSDLPFGLYGFSFEINSLCDENLKMSETGGQPSDRLQD